MIRSFGTWFSYYLQFAEKKIELRENSLSSNTGERTPKNERIEGNQQGFSVVLDLFCWIN